MATICPGCGGQGVNTESDFDCLIDGCCGCACHTMPPCICCTEHRVCGDCEGQGEIADPCTHKDVVPAFAFGRFYCKACPATLVWEGCEWKEIP